MNATTAIEQTALTTPEATQAGALALLTLSPEKFVAEVYAPFTAKLESAIDGVKSVDYDIKTTAGMAVANKARATFRDLRLAADAARKDRKAPIIKIGKLLESGYDQVEARIAPLEDLFDADIKAEEQHKEDVKTAKIAAERMRTESIEAKIAILVAMPAVHAMSDAATLADAIAEYDGWSADPEIYEEFADKAAEAVVVSLVTMRDMLTARQQSEAAALAVEQARIAEAERLAAEKVELARQRAENERIANEQAAERRRLAKLAEAQEAAAAKLREQAEANLKAERDAQIAAAAESKRQMDAQLAALAEQSRKLAEQKAAADARDADALAAIQVAQVRERCHGEALGMNAQFDADRIAELAELVVAPADDDLVRCQGLADQLLADAGAPQTLDSLINMVNAGEMDITDLPLQDSEIIDVVCDEFNLSRADAIDRLQQIDFAAAHAMVQA